MRITSLVFPMLMFGIYAAGDATSVNAQLDRDKPGIYAHMSANFMGNPDQPTLQMSTKAVLRKYALPQTKRQIYDLGSLVFVLARKTGVAEIDILHCIARSQMARTIELAAGECVGIHDYSISRTL